MYVRRFVAIPLVTACPADAVSLRVYRRRRVTKFPTATSTFPFDL